MDNLTKCATVSPQRLTIRTEIEETASVLAGMYSRLGALIKFIGAGEMELLPQSDETCLLHSACEMKVLARKVDALVDQLGNHIF